MLRGNRAESVFASARQPEAVPGEETVSDVEQARDAGQAGWSHEPAEADGRVELAEDFDAADDRAIWQAAVDLGHQLIA
jgi:hypothetical protein